jgi:PIN domain nuclease of toxin-antitoxin system
VADLAVTDSHALIWYATKRKRRLGSKAKRLFERADSGGAAVYVPSIVLVEVAEASHRGVVSFRSNFANWCSQLFSSPHFIAVDLGVDVVIKADELYAIPERGDRLIAATAAVLGLPLMTREPEIAEAAGIELLW